MIALLCLLRGEARESDRVRLACVLEMVWAFRLGAFLFGRILLWGEDNRFDEIRVNKLKFLGFWVRRRGVVCWIFSSRLLECWMGHRCSAVPCGLLCRPLQPSPSPSCSMTPVPSCVVSDGIVRDYRMRCAPRARLVALLSLSSPVRRHSPVWPCHPSQHSTYYPRTSSFPLSSCAVWLMAL